MTPEEFQNFAARFKNTVRNYGLFGLVDAVRRRVSRYQLRKVNRFGHPGLSPVNISTRDIDPIKLNIKAMGYQLARELRKQIPQPDHTEAQPLGLSCRATRQVEFEQPWFIHWCRQLQIPVIYHRKIWEFAFVLQSLHDTGLLKAGASGLGFGCGEEPLPSYFANLGMKVTVTDLDPEQVRGMGWANTGQHSAALDSVYFPELVDEARLKELVSLRYVDMNAIPDDLTGYDFCWSICALEHLGSIKKGLDFIENSMKTLKPGGLALHTTEFNFLDDKETLDNWSTVLFQRCHFEEIAARLRAAGHEVAPLSFDVGHGPVDRFIDMPPYEWERIALSKGNRASDNHDGHLKLAVEGFVSTCFGMVIRKKA